MTNFTAKKLEITAQELNHPDQQYTFVAYEFENGLILVPGDSTPDWFFNNRDEIQPSGNAVVDSIAEAGVEVTFTTEELQESLEAYVKEYDVEPEANLLALLA